MLHHRLSKHRVCEAECAVGVFAQKKSNVMQVSDFVRQVMYVRSRLMDGFTSEIGKITKSKKEKRAMLIVNND